VNYRLPFTFRLPLLFTLFLSAGCEATLPPLRGKAEVGRDAYLVFVGGSALSSDLYAVLGDGGQAVPLTFTPVAEMSPVLAPNGGAVAFLRARSLRDSTPATVWVLNLLSGADRELRLPKGAGAPWQVGWSKDGEFVIVQTDGGLFRIKSPPNKPEPRPIAPLELAAAESSLSVLLGDPVFARVVPCSTPGTLCVATDSGQGFLARGAQQAVRWGSDSVALLIGKQLEIRPLGPGRPRRLAWSNLPQSPRQLTYFAGKPLP
jgi:hypothetical protein